MVEDTLPKRVSLDDPSEVDPLLGRTVAGRFRVESLLGEGGIGRVYKALQLELDRYCALKVLHPEFALRQDMTTRFQREARAASMLSHPGSVVVYDFGNWEGRLFIAMELLDGRTLTEVLEAEYPLEADRVVGFIVQLCDVLDVAHSMDLLHRDLKPDNVIITLDKEDNEQVKVVDFGLAILMERDRDNRVTKEGTVSGTPSYMSPEQALAKDLDARSDLYAVGCIMYECLTGGPPFEGSSPVDVLAKHLYDEAEPPSARTRQPIEPGIEAACMWPLQKNAANRPQTAAEMKRALLKASEAVQGESIEHLIADRVMTREARATAAGIAPTARSSRIDTDKPYAVLVFQAPETLFNQSAVSVLRAQGMACQTISAVEEIPDLEATGTEAIVVDLRPDVAASLPMLPGWVTTAGERRPVVVIGPDDDIETMTAALAARVADYVPQSMLSKLPKKIIRGIRRRRRNAAPAADKGAE